jgi:uncharacterized surface protein with fasciclin (FAS1) repeats
MRKLLIAGAVLALSLTGCDEAGKGDENGTATASGEAGLGAIDDAEGLSTAAKLLKDAGLEKMLEGRGSYTIFAPSDEAFAALPEDQRKSLQSEEGRPQLLALLRQHMASGYLTAEDIAKNAGDADGLQLASLGAGPIAVRAQDDKILLGEGEAAARVVGAPVAAGNNIVYRIDRLIPPPAA